MTILTAVVLGIVEGITEFLPISSTGHLILAEKLAGMQTTDMLESFDIVIQLGAILAVVVIYAKSLLRTPKIWLPIFVAFLPTAVIGLALHHILKTYLLGNTTVVALSLLMGGIVIIAFEAKYKERRGAVKRIEDVSLPTAIGIGLCQSIAIVPGVSRSAATIIGGMMLGVDRKTIVDFSFLLAIPTMAAATGYDLVKSAHAFSSHDALTLLVGFIVAFVTALIAIRWLLSFIRSHTFTPFGIYRVLVGLLFLLWIR